MYTSLFNMTDVFNSRKRSAVMAAIRSKGNLSTELRLVSLLRANKIFGWRRHQHLPGKPDFLFSKHRLAIFVDGCFWHGCARCRTIPVGNRSFWLKKITQNRKRDNSITKVLKASGWTVLRLWEHELRNGQRAITRIQRAIRRAESRG